jgi:hypothetical protein
VGIFGLYDQVSPTGAAGMAKGYMVGVTFGAVINSIVVDVMPGMASGCTGCAAGGWNPVTAIAIIGSDERVATPRRSRFFKMTIDIGTASQLRIDIG